MRKWVAQQHVLCWFWEYPEYLVNIPRTQLKEDLDLVAWCERNRCKIVHNWVECEDQQAWMLFALRWVDQ